MDTDGDKATAGGTATRVGGLLRYHVSLAWRRAASGDHSRSGGTKRKAEKNSTAKAPRTPEG